MKNRKCNSLFAATMLLGFLFSSFCLAAFSTKDLSYYVPSENLAMDCSPDLGSYFRSNPSNRLKIDPSTVSRAYALNPGNSRRPEISACIFRKKFTYSFPVSVGPMFIRLYFKPINYSGFSISKALFSVEVGLYKLLTTSESSYSKLSSDADYVAREFCINVEGQALNVTFTPTSAVPGSYAFVNRIEIISMPSKLYITDSPLPLVGHSSQYFVDTSTVLEMMHRLNIGGRSIPQHKDNGMFRLWTGDDHDFMINEDQTATVESGVEIKQSSLRYAAPIQLYTSATAILDMSTRNYSARWSLPVDSGFYYLVRLHFCEISRVIKQNGQRVFHVYINNQTAEDHADIFYWSHGAGIPTYRDYIVNLSQHGQGIMYLQISMRQDRGSPAHPILNGLEVFKLSDLSHNLAGSHPFGVRFQNFSDYKVHSGLLAPRVGEAISFVFVATAFLSWTCYFVSKLKSWRKTSKSEQSSECCVIFSIDQIKTATNNFSDSLLIGAGGFGNVYRGSIDNGSTIVAIKRANTNSHQGLTEFQTEISMLASLRHCHLVSLVGYCKDQEMILVYDYMAKGTLRDHLYNTQKAPLAWKQRLEICIGAARGLHHLHTGAKNTIIHRDIKSSNILLDDNFVAKVSDFGLSKISPSTIGEPDLYVSTLVKGTFGYLDPEYFGGWKLTEKSDVYSFGVVLLETLCARPAVLPMREIEEEEYVKVNLARWALNCYQTGILEQIIDPYLNGKIAPECFKTFTDITLKCLADRGSERPSMGDVLCNLELAMKQQSAADSKNDKPLKEISGRMKDDASIAKNEDEHCIFFEHSDRTPGVEFSEIMVPVGL